MKSFPESLSLADGLIREKGESKKVCNNSDKLLGSELAGGLTIVSRSIAVCKSSLGLSASSIARIARSMCCMNWLASVGDVLRIAKG